MPEKTDLLVIGSGPGGYVAAIRASQLGLKTTVIEKAEVGGICLNWGCIPTKALLHSATLFNHINHSQNFGIQVTGAAVDLAKMVKHSRNTAQRLSKGIEFLFKKNNITVLRGQAKIIGKGRVELISVDGGRQEIETANILLATGGRPRSVPGMEFDGRQIISSREALVPEKIPSSLLIIGAGAIGVEFAYFYASIGTRVSLVEMMPHILPQEDEEAVEVVVRALKKQGITILTESRVEKVVKDNSALQVQITTPTGNQTLQAELALVAIGVTGNVENLGLETVGIQPERGFIPVNRKSYQTAAEGIYAIGDVIGPPLLAHVASAEGVCAAEFIAGQTPVEIDYGYIPGCTYCQPQIASLGLTEEQTKKQGLAVKIGRFPFRANGKSLAMGESEGFVKLIFDAHLGELLGAHIVGSEATELLAELGLARTLESTAEEIQHTMHAHPTISESIKEAAEDALGHAIHI